MSIDPIEGRLVEKLQSAKVSSEIGIISREFGFCPVSFPQFKEDERALVYDQIRVRLLLCFFIFLKYLMSTNYLNNFGLVLTFYYCHYFYICFFK